MNILDFIKPILKAYWKKQWADYKLYFRLAKKAGYKWGDDPLKAATVGFKAGAWVLFKGTPTLAGVKKDLGIK